MSLSERELATTLAALRLWQKHLAGNVREFDDYFQEGVTPLSAGEIDELCERLNTIRYAKPNPAAGHTAAGRGTAMPVFEVKLSRTVRTVNRDYEETVVLVEAPDKAAATQCLNENFEEIQHVLDDWDRTNSETVDSESVETVVGEPVELTGPHRDADIKVDDSGAWDY